MEEQAARDLSAIRQVLEGNGEAFADLVTRYQAMVAGIAWRHGFRREDVEDIVSEVFVKTYRSLHRFRPDFPFSTWLYRLAANHAVDRMRRARKEAGRTEMPAQVEDPAPGPVVMAEKRERARLVREALEQVGPRYREALRLVYVEGLKVDEAARILGVPAGTVKTRLMRGREALKKTLGRPGRFGDNDAV